MLVLSLVLGAVLAAGMFGSAGPRSDQMGGMGGLIGAKGGGEASTTAGQATVEGPLDKALVEAVVRRHQNQIRFCYQRELTKNPSLEGKIVVRFVIAGDGTVSSAETQSSTMGNGAVESCINGRFMRAQFPVPKDGGIVIVSYPFLFSPG